MRKKKTDRGFVRIEFKDFNGEECMLQKSSIATEHCVWLGYSPGQMHLSQKAVKRLLPHLTKFAETGEL